MYTIWGRPNCVWCKRTMEVMIEENLVYKYIELTPDNLNLFTSMTGGAKTVPQIIDKDGTLIGGYTEFRNSLG